MDNYVAIVVTGEKKAFEALHALRRLDERGEVTVHGAAVIRRNERNEYEVVTKRLDEGLRTLAGAAIGALIGALAGPVGSAAGVVAGAGAGGIAGLTADAVKFGEREEAAYESGIVVKAGECAAIAEVDEDEVQSVDKIAGNLGGRLYRRSKKHVRDASIFGDEYIDRLLPYDYEPHR